MQYIEDGAFEYTGIEKIEIPETVFLIEDNAFAHCKDLAVVEWNTKVNIAGDKIKKIFNDSNVKTVIKNGSKISFSDFIKNIDDLIKSKSQDSKDLFTFKKVELEL